MTKKCSIEDITWPRGNNYQTLHDLSYPQVLLSSVGDKNYGVLPLGGETNLRACSWDLVVTFQFFRVSSALGRQLG